MNKITYKVFNQELEKQANIFTGIGKSVAKGTELIWKHPKTTLSLLAGGFIASKLLNALFPPVLLGTQFNQSHIMNNQSEIMREILKQEQLKNLKPKPIFSPQKKIERPLV